MASLSVSAAARRNKCRWPISLLIGALVVIAARASISAVSAADASGKYITENLRGKVVWLSDVLEKEFEISVDDDSEHTIVALQTASGELHPLVKDFRGRGFHLDERLRDRELELVIRRHPGVPLVQVVRVYSIVDEQHFELDYWCDVCAIAMYELKPCECCQGEIRIRERPVDRPPDRDQ